MSPSFPLAPMQRGMLFQTLLAPGSGGYIEQMVAELHEDLQVGLFRELWQQAVERHSMLRARFHWEGLQEPVQEVAPEAVIPWKVEDWSGISADAQQSALDRYLSEDRAAGFALDHAPLIRAALFRRGDRSWCFALSSHHLLMDGRSHRVLLLEVFGAYAARLRGELLTFPEFRPFSDYIDFLQKRDPAADQAYWRAQLAGFETPNVLRFQKSPGDAGTLTEVTDEKGLSLPEPLTVALTRHAEQEGVTLNTVLQAAWAVLLQYYSGQEDVVFGVIRSCRRSGLPGGENTVGLFINTLPMRLQLKPTMTWSELLRVTREQWLGMREHEHAPLEAIQTWNELPKGTSLFDSLFMFETYQLDAEMRSQGPDWESRRFRLLEQTNHPFTFSVYGGKTLLVKAEYDTDRFSAESVEAVLGHYQRLLESVLIRPDAPLRSLPILTAREERTLLVDWEPKRVGLPASGGYLSLFDDQVARTPDQLAIDCEDGTLSYREMDERANRLAHYLRALGVGAETLVGVCIERSRDMGVAFLGIWKAGGAYVPLDPGYPQDRLAFMLQDAGIKVLLTQSHLLGALPPHSATVVQLDVDWPLIASQPAARLSNDLGPDSLAYVIYTSGSTGQPKGVQLTHRGLVNHNLAVCELAKLTPADRVLQICSLCFDISVEELFPTWISGATLVPAPRGRILPDASFTEFVRENGLTFLDLSTAFWQEWVHELDRAQQPLPPTVRLVVVGGEKTSTAAYDLWRRVSKDKVRWVDGYGPTETTVAATTYEPRLVGSSGAAPDGGSSIGRPLPNTHALVLDSWGRLLPVGVPGELLIGGAGLARGYLKRPELTAEKFIAHPFRHETDERLYRTGDLVRWRADGNLEFLGRIDHQVKIRGYRIELGEIEARLARHPGVKAVVVIDREDTPGDRRLVAYYLAGSPAPSTKELVQFLSVDLPHYMVPAAWVALGAFPLMPNGKLNRRGLPAPAYESPPATSAQEAASDELEQQIAAIWEEVLGVRRVLRTDNFFELGGHSLLAVRLFSVIHSRLGQNIPLVALFHAPTVAGLATWVREHGAGTGWSSLVAIQPGGTRLPLFCVHAAGGNVLFYRDLARRLGPDQPFYGLQPRGLDGKHPYHESIPEMAAHYISEMRTVQPRGPYYVGGASYGGIVAWEIAQQLHAAGETVALLALFDTNGPGYPRYRPGIGKLRLRFYRSLQRVQQHCGNLWLLPKEQRLGYVLQKAKKAQLQVRRAGRRGVRRLSAHMHQLLGRPLPDVLLQTQHAIQRAYDTYQLRPYPGRVTLFRASRQAWGIIKDPKLGWGNCSPGGLEVVEVPGFHGTVVTEPCVQFLVKAMAPYMPATNSRKG